MDIEKTIEFLRASAPHHYLRIAAAERNNVILRNALIELTSLVQRLSENRGTDRPPTPH